MMRRSRRPLLRTAGVGGAAYMAGSSAATRSAEQAQREAQQNAQIAELQQQQAAMMQQAPQPMQQPASAVSPQPTAQSKQPTGAGAPARDPIEMLKSLGQLKDAGVLTEDEFQAKKAELLKQI